MGEWPPAAPLTFQLTLILLVPDTVAVNCCCALGATVAFEGLIVTVMAPPVETPEEDDALLFPPPHPFEISAEKHSAVQSHIGCASLRSILSRLSPAESAYAFWLDASSAAANTKARG